ncbi:hypothetical protein [Ruegeria atlantica]|uniref:hypothetical protein n=1 Tax=Ruegeria atlantica TaxID=81569 RepID=UPI00147B4477|nr:hypothetical protein [Ruegeria atlantica]
MKENNVPFFVGYLPVPKGLRRFLLLVAFALASLVGIFGYLIGVTQDAPGSGAFLFDFGRQTVGGVIERTPVPILHITEGNSLLPAGHTLMLSGPGKNGIMNTRDIQDGASVTVSGIVLKRGSLDMLQVPDGPNGLRPNEGSDPTPAFIDLGRWKLAGEICDGKCLAGAMRPGRGLAHKACANLCIVGGTPPVFVSSQPIMGTEFLLLSGPNRTEIPSQVYDRMARYILVEGQITQHGDILVFAMEPETIEVLP